jgi:hypothetical protein
VRLSPGIVPPKWNDARLPLGFPPEGESSQRAAWLVFDLPKQGRHRDVRLTEVGRTPWRSTHRSGKAAGVTFEPTEAGRMSAAVTEPERPKSFVLGLLTSTLPEQRPRQPPLEKVTNDLPSRLPFDSYRSRCRAAGCRLVAPGGATRRRPVSDRAPRSSCDRSWRSIRRSPKRAPSRSRSSKKWLRARRRK